MDIQHLKSVLENGDPQGWGGRFPESGFEEVGYFDVLLGDSGLINWRKMGLWRELVESYGVGDYRKLLREWMATREREEGVLGWLMVCSELIHGCCS